MEFLEQLSSMVAMTAELCCGTIDVTTRSLTIEEIPLQASLFCTEIVHR